MTAEITLEPAAVEVLRQGHSFDALRFVEVRTVHADRRGITRRTVLQYEDTFFAFTWHTPQHTVALHGCSEPVTAKRVWRITTTQTHYQEEPPC